MSKLKYGEFSFPAPTARPTASGYARGGKAPTKGQAKVAKVMGEFKRGDLHSGSAKGPIVKNPKQAIAIAMSEKKAAGYKDGGNAKKGEKSAKLVGMKREPEAIVKKEVVVEVKESEEDKMPKIAPGWICIRKNPKTGKYETIQGPLTEEQKDYDRIRYLEQHDLKYNMYKTIERMETRWFEYKEQFDERYGQGAYNEKYGVNSYDSDSDGSDYDYDSDDDSDSEYE
jgi:hypothetical protein